MNMNLASAGTGPRYIAFNDPGFIRRSGIPGLGAVDVSTMPQFTSASMPTMTGTAEAATGGTPQGNMLPTDFMQRLPTIVDSTPTMAPWCGGIGTWINGNPLVAGLGLMALALIVFGGGIGGGRK